MLTTNAQEMLAQQLRYTEALARCSRTLLHGSLGSETNCDVLNEALNYLLIGTGVVRIGLFAAHTDPEEGPYSLLIAEAVLPPHPSKLAELQGAHIPAKPAMRAQLMAGQTIRFTLRELDYTPAEQSKLDVHSWLLCPIQFAGSFWGNLACGAAEDDRQWSEHEVMLLQTAGDVRAHAPELAGASRAAYLLAQIQAQSQQISRILDTIPEDVLLLDQEARVLFANPTGARDLMVLAAAAVGDRLTQLGDMPLVICSPRRKAARA